MYKNYKVWSREEDGSWQLEWEYRTKADALDYAKNYLFPYYEGKKRVQVELVKGEKGYWINNEIIYTKYTKEDQKANRLAKKQMIAELSEAR